jgi:site-specific DNA-methyltransferase (adenine-specific)
MNPELINADCIDWLKKRKENSIHAVVTDPPFGMREYSPEEILKLRNGKGGIWRIPPTFDGSKRKPLPRYTVLTEEDIESIRNFFLSWGKEIERVLVPGGHIFIAGNPLVNHVVYNALEEAHLEKRGEIIRIVRTLRGGDRPKGAEKKYSDISAMPRACYEPWGLFRKDLDGKLSKNLEKWGTGGLRRPETDKPFEDMIESERTPKPEKNISPHPSLKPQRFMRQIVHSSLPLGKGVIVDTFMGGGSTIAAAEAIGYKSIGIEIDETYFNMATKAIPILSRINCEVQCGSGQTKLHHNQIEEKEIVY